MTVLRDDRAPAAAPLILSGGPIYTADASANIAEALAIVGDRILAVGDRQSVAARAGPGARTIDLAGRCAVPGFIDGHAHMDREGLKSVWPSLAGVQSIDDLLRRIASLAEKAAPGDWIVTMPIGDPPHYHKVPALLKEGRYPTRWDLDRAAPRNPVYIRPIWGYWRYEPPLVSIANSLALALAGIDASTPPPSPEVTIERDPGTGEPTGVFIEHTDMSAVELTLMAAAPHFSLPQRIDGLARSMSLYNQLGTTGVFEGHGVAPETIAAYQALHGTARQTVRATLAFSPSWSGCGADAAPRMLRDWGRWLAGRGFGDDWLRVQGIFAEKGGDPRHEPRAAALPQTGWAGFCYDAALPRDALREVLLEAARNRIRVSTIRSEIVDLYHEVHRHVPIDGQRWVWVHIGELSRDRIRLAKELGLVLTTHTNRHIWNEGGRHLDRLGAEGAERIVPLRDLLDDGVSVAFGSDNVPPSLLHPIYHAVARRDRTGRVIAEGQKLTRQEALRCASAGGAYLAGVEHALGSLEPGKLADVTVLSDDLMTVPEDEIPFLVADLTIVGGRIVWQRTVARE